MTIRRKKRNPEIKEDILDVDELDEIFEVKGPGRPRGTKKVGTPSIVTYEIVIGILRFVFRKHGIPRVVLNKIFYLLESPHFSNYVLRVIERSMHALITEQISNAAHLGISKIKGKVFRPNAIDPEILIDEAYRAEVAEQDGALFLIKIAAKSFTRGFLGTLALKIFYRLATDKKVQESIRKGLAKTIKKVAKLAEPNEVSAWLKTVPEVVKETFYASVKVAQKKTKTKSKKINVPKDIAYPSGFKTIVGGMGKHIAEMKKEGASAAKIAKEKEQMESIIAHWPKKYVDSSFAKKKTKVRKNACKSAKNPTEAYIHEGDERRVVIETSEGLTYWPIMYLDGSIVWDTPTVPSKRIQTKVRELFKQLYEEDPTLIEDDARLAASLERTHGIPMSSKHKKVYESLFKRNPRKSEKLHKIYDKLHSFIIDTKDGQMEVTLKGPAKVYGIEGGLNSGALLLKGSGLKGFNLKGCKLIRIDAQKGTKSNWPKENFYHPFTSKPTITIRKDGELLCKGTKPLHKEFNYPDK